MDTHIDTRIIYQSVNHLTRPCQVPAGTHFILGHSFFFLSSISLCLSCLYPIHLIFFWNFFSFFSLFFLNWVCVCVCVSAKWQKKKEDKQRGNHVLLVWFKHGWFQTLFPSFQQDPHTWWCADLIRQFQLEKSSQIEFLDSSSKEKKTKQSSYSFRRGVVLKFCV